MDAFTLKKTEFNEVRGILAGFCACSLGKALAAHLGPSRSPETVAGWLAQTSQMLQAIRDVSLPPLAGIADVREAVGRAHPGGGAGGEDFAAIASVLEALAALRSWLAALGEPLEAVRALAGEIGTFDVELRAIREVVESDGAIRDDASERLLRLRLEIRGTARQIRDVIYGYLQDPEVSQLLQNATVTLHGDRYVLPVKAENRGRLSGVVHRASNTGATVFIEPNACVELNNRLADLATDERREIERLLNVLSIHVQARSEDILRSLRAAAEADLIAAKAQYACQFDMTCPEVTENGPLQFTQARHPLLIDQAWRQEKEGLPADQRHAVVPVDLRLGSDFDLLVITGSNTGGKTVTLKTAALLVLMAQSGLHIPAQRGATMPVFHDVLLDVGDEQSLQQSLSTFGAHVKRVRFILARARKNCLVLLDELGSGTDPDEGAAIGQAVLDELRDIGCLGMVTTHLSALKAYAEITDRVRNASVDFDTTTLSPTYHLRIGTPGESHAITVAARLGIPRRIVAAARRHLTEQGKQFRRAIRSTAQARQVAEEARAQAVAAELAARTQQESYEAKLADLHRLQEEFETWLATLPQLKPGHEVPVPSLNKTGRLVRMELHRQIALVESDGVQVEVPLSDLMPDLGQQAVREQIATLRRQIMDQARQTEQGRAEAERMRDEYHRSLAQQRQRARQFDEWLGAIARLRVGDTVPIALRPGSGTLLSVDLPGLRATVQTADGEKTLSIQDLFPQTGPFARRAPRQREPAGGQAQRTTRWRGGEGRAPAEHAERGAGGDERRPPAKDRPMSRGKAPAGLRKDLTGLKEGDQVYVVPFHKRATLIRLKADKQSAVVQSGIFELEVPLSDIEAIRRHEEPPRAKPPRPAKRQAEATDQPPAHDAGAQEAPPAADQAAGDEAPDADAESADSGEHEAPDDNVGDDADATDHEAP